MERPKSYPQLEAEFRKVCRSEASCRQHLASLRWSKAVLCPYCGEQDGPKAWSRSGGAYKCSGCRREFRVTTGTIFQDSRLTLRRWFKMIWGMAYDSNLHSAAGFKRQFFPKQLKNPVTAWRSQQKLRRLMWPSGELLKGDVEFGTFKLGSRGGSSHFVALFVQRRHNRRGQLRLARVQDSSPATIQKCIRENVDPASTLFGPAWKDYALLGEAGYELRGGGNEDLLWISKTVREVEDSFRGTHRGAIRPSAVDDYLNEFAFRFNARRFAKPGKIFHTLLQRAMRPRPSAHCGRAGLALAQSETARIEPMNVAKRMLGSTGFNASILGIGDLADRTVPIETCVATIRRAMDLGLNVIDTAPGYEDGYSEAIVGAALKGRREGMFVIDKIDHLDKPVGPQVDSSLRALGLEMVDLFVFHAVSELARWKELAAPDGGMDQLGREVRAGKVRFRGISSHHPEVLREAVESGLCDVVMFPIGPFCDRRYIDEVLPLARQKGVGTVCFKTFGAGKLLGDTTGYNRPLEPRPRGKFSSGGKEGDAVPVLPRLTVAECLHYTLTIGPEVALLGLSFPNEQEAAFRALSTFRPLTQDQMEETRRRAAQAIEGKGPCWWNPASG